MKKYYEILGLKEGASKEEIKKAYNKLSKELDPKKNNNEEFFVEETKKLNEAYDKLMNSSILSISKKSHIKKQNVENKINHNKKHMSKSNQPIILKIITEIISGVLSILMIKVISQIIFYPEDSGVRRGYSDYFKIDYDEMFIFNIDSDYSLSGYILIFSIFLYLFLRFLLRLDYSKIIKNVFYLFIIMILILRISYSIYLTT